MSENTNIQERENDIIIIHPPHHRRKGSGLVQPIGLAYLASSIIMQGFTVKVIDCAKMISKLDSDSLKELNKKLHNEIAESPPKLALGIGPCTTSSIRGIKSIADLCNKKFPSIPLIYGGPLTLIPEQDWLFFDELHAYCVVRGDGEITLPSVLTSLRKGESHHVEGAQYSKEQDTKPVFISSLDNIPPPVWDVFSMSDYYPSLRRDLFAIPWAPIIGSRGCKYKCKFCISGQFIDYRINSYQYISDNVQRLIEKYKIKALIFYDDCLFPSSLKINEDIRTFTDTVFCNIHDVVWQMEMRPDIFSEISEESLKLLYQNGCRQINLGIENATTSNLRALSKNFDIVKLKNACDNAINIVPKLRLTGTFILGGPGETESTIMDTVNYSTSLNLVFAHYYPLEIYPGTPLYSEIYGNDNKKWYELIMNDHLNWGEILYSQENIGDSKILDMVDIAYNRFYEREEWKELIKKQLGSNYNEKAQMVIQSWVGDRFKLKEVIK